MVHVIYASPASINEIAKLLCASLNKQSDLEPIPTFLLKQVSATILYIITTIVNIFLFTGTFPIHLKQSLVTPLLKKPYFDKDSLNNYRPISNLSIISKITECIVKPKRTPFI